MAVSKLLCLLVLASTLMLLPLPPAQTMSTRCDPDQYYDTALHSCKPCFDICEPLRDTMGQCQTECPQSYCTQMCDTNNLQDGCFGETCKGYADSHVACFPKNETPTSGYEKPADCAMFSRGGIGVFVAVQIVMAGLFFLGGFMTRGKLSGAGFWDFKASVQEASHRPERDRLQPSPGNAVNGVDHIMVKEGQTQQNGV